VFVSANYHVVASVHPDENPDVGVFVLPELAAAHSAGLSVDVGGKLYRASPFSVDAVNVANIELPLCNSYYLAIFIGPVCFLEFQV